MTREQWLERFRYTHELYEFRSLWSEMETEVSDEDLDWFQEKYWGFEIPDGLSATVTCEDTWGDSAGWYAVREYSDGSYVLYEDDTETLTLFRPSADPDEDIPFMPEDVLWSYGEDDMPFWGLGLYGEMQKMLEVK